MINKDFEEYPEHRTHFFLLLQAVNLYCFAAFLNIPAAQFKLVLDSVIWAFKHTMRNVADTGLNILFQLLQNVGSAAADAAQSFYRTYYTDILQHLFSVVTDTSHTAGLTMHATILAYMFTLVETGKVTDTFDSAGRLQSLTPAQVSASNVTYVTDFAANLLRTAFPHLTDNQIKITVQGLFNLNQDIPAFKEHLRDFLVQIREFTGMRLCLFLLAAHADSLVAGEDDSDLFLEQREAALKKAQEEKRKIQVSIPGMLNPHEKGAVGQSEDMQEM